MKITLKQNLGENSGKVPYLADIEITRLTVDIEKNFQVPIYRHEVKGKEYYTAHVCGFQVEADDSPETIISLLDQLVPTLVNMSRLPTYVFIARRSHRMYPVYTISNEVFATTPGGPIFKHVELAKVREYLTDYLNTTGVLGEPSKSEKLHVRGVRRSNLALTRPLFYLKKRRQTNDDTEFWAPVFQTDGGEAIYAYAASGRRQVDVDGGHEILRLRTQVAQALIADKRLKDEHDLRADRLLPEYWEKIQPSMQTVSSKLWYNGTAFDLYQEGKYLLAIEYRSDEDRYSLYIGTNPGDLQKRAAADLIRRKLINQPDLVRMEV